ncbi:MAG: hypothetical protein ABUK01_14020 [Leptospirales bacterium]
MGTSVFYIRKDRAMVKALIDLIIALFHNKTQVSNETVKNIVSLRAEGNISLQNGKYITDEDIEKLRKKVKKLKFS